MVLDADLGQSGSSTGGRDDFSLLTADVALGHVGIIFGWEAGLCKSQKRAKQEANSIQGMSIKEAHVLGDIGDA